MAINKLTSLFTDIANAIREKTGRTDSIVADRFPFVLASIPDNNLLISIVDRTVVDIPETYLSGITSIGARAFEGCKKLDLTSLPDGITEIGRHAFYGCNNLTHLTSLPESITSIGSYAFAFSNLTTLTFKGTPAHIEIDALINCSNLKTINVPWAEGEVDGAPWGATKATINYNYVE